MKEKFPWSMITIRSSKLQYFLDPIWHTHHHSTKAHENIESTTRFCFSFYGNDRLKAHDQLPNVNHHMCQPYINQFRWHTLKFLGTQTTWDPFSRQFIFKRNRAFLIWLQVDKIKSTTNKTPARHHIFNLFCAHASSKPRKKKRIS